MRLAGWLVASVFSAGLLKKGARSVRMLTQRSVAKLRK